MKKTNHKNDCFELKTEIINLASDVCLCLLKKVEESKEACPEVSLSTHEMFLFLHGILTFKMFFF